MKLKMSRQEFLSRWRALRGYAPLRNDVSLSRSDGLDFDARLEAEMDGWYRRLVLEGDESLLAPEELAPGVSLSAPADGCVTLTLPPHAARVTGVRLSGWRRAATVVTDPECNLALRQLHPYTRACEANPVAIVYPDGEMALYPASESDRLVSLRCAMMRDNEFAFDSAALALTDDVMNCE